MTQSIVLDEPMDTDRCKDGLQGSVENARKLMKHGLQQIDVRVPRKREEVLWRLALYLRHRTNLIRREGNVVHASWNDLANLLEWKEAPALESHCQDKLERAFDNQGSNSCNIFALLMETQGLPMVRPNLEASMNAVAA